MERVQIDLTEMYGPKSPLLSQSSHKYRIILSVMDCISKCCWLTPLTNKSADTVVHATEMYEPNLHNSLLQYCTSCEKQDKESYGVHQQLMLTAKDLLRL